MSPSNRLGQIEESIIEAAVKLDVAVGVGGGTTDIRWMPSLESLPWTPVEGSTILHLCPQGGQGGGAANDREGDGEGEAEERARHREDDRLDHGQRGRGREAWEGRQPTDFSFLNISPTLSREAEQREKFKRKREAMKARQKKKKVAIFFIRTRNLSACVCAVGGAQNGKNSAGAVSWGGHGGEGERSREGVVSLLRGRGHRHIHQEHLGPLDLDLGAHPSFCVVTLRQ